MLDKLLLQIASDLCSFCHLGNFLGEIPAGRKGNTLFMAASDSATQPPCQLEETRWIVLCPINEIWSIMPYQLNRTWRSCHAN